MTTISMNQLADVTGGTSFLSDATELRVSAPAAAGRACRPVFHRRERAHVGVQHRGPPERSSGAKVGHRGPPAPSSSSTTRWASKLRLRESGSRREIAMAVDRRFRKSSRSASDRSGRSSPRPRRGPARAGAESKRCQATRSSSVPSAIRIRPEPEPVLDQAVAAVVDADDQEVDVTAVDRDVGAREIGRRQQLGRRVPSAARR